MCTEEYRYELSSTLILLTTPPLTIRISIIPDPSAFPVGVHCPVGTQMQVWPVVGVTIFTTGDAAIVVGIAAGKVGNPGSVVPCRPTNFCHRNIFWKNNQFYDNLPSKPGSVSPLFTGWGAPSGKLICACTDGIMSECRDSTVKYTRNHRWPLYLYI